MGKYLFVSLHHMFWEAYIYKLYFWGDLLNINSAYEETLKETHLCFDQVSWLTAGRDDHQHQLCSVSCVFGDSPRVLTGLLIGLGGLIPNTFTALMTN